MTVRVIGVRHHSPACARLVQRVIARDKPACVLIEGPGDFNPRLGELLLEHTLPVLVSFFGLFTRMGGSAQRSAGGGATALY